MASAEEEVERPASERGHKSAQLHELHNFFGADLQNELCLSAKNIKKYYDVLCNGSPPEEPVISKTGGFLFERRLIEKETGECPVTHTPLSLDDLQPVKTNKVIKPRTGAATSIPGLLSIFHNEWDAVMLEMFQLKEALDTRNKELATALYQFDAATRVIARLTKERDEARQGLAAAPASGKRHGDAMDVDSGAGKKAKGGITADVVQRMTDTAAGLSKGRKKRPLPPGLASPEAIGSYALADSLPLHSSAKPGILAVALHAGNADVVATAGADKTAVVFDKAKGAKLAVLSGHGKQVTDVAFAGDALLTACADKSVRLWRPDSAGGYSLGATMSDHQGEVAAVTVHASGVYAVSMGADATWCFYDLPSATCLSQVSDPTVQSAYTCGSFHPDGLILGTGSADSFVRIWDAKSQSNVATFEGHTAAIAALSFSENGFYLATAAQDGVKLWDLRKLKNFQTLCAGEACESLDFDQSGAYLAVGGAEARVFGVKQDFSLVKAFPKVAKKAVSALRFGPDASFLLAASASDHNLRVYTAA